MKRLTFQFSVGLIFALPPALISFAFAQAGTPTATPAGQAPQCKDCHAEFQTAWEDGAHGKAITDPAFQSEWEAEGKPKECLGCHTTGFDPVTGTYQAEGVTCNACHDPVASNHPLAPASMSRSASLCGECHRDTYFEWQASKHGQSDLTCVNCHDPHATSLRAKDASTLCASCHGTRVAAFGHTHHAAQGLTCVDCHIGDSNGKNGIMGKGKHSHTFAVNLDKCTKCHAAEMHSPAAAMLVPAVTPAVASSLASGEPTTASAEPKPVSPAGFAILTGLIGLAFGIVLAPWLERGFRRLTRGDKRNEVRP